MISYAPTATDRIVLMRERCERILSAVGEAQSHLYATGENASRAESDVIDTLARLERMIEQLDREMQRDDAASAEYTLSVVIAVIQGELPVRLRALANATSDPRAAAVAREWADDLTDLAESEAA